MDDTAFTPSVDSLVRALRTGKGRAAAEIFQQMIALGGDPGAAGRETGEALLSVWDDFCVEAVGGFTAWLEQFPDRQAAQAALEPVARALEMTAQWERMLRDVAGEREARILREQVRGGNLSGALDLCRRILSASRSAEALRASAIRLGVILGSLDNDRPAADKVMTQLGNDLRGKGAPGVAAAAAIAEGCDESRKNLSLTQTGQRELQWNRMHTDAVVDLIRHLPDAATAGQPTPEQEARAWRGFHSAVAAWFRQSANGADFGDLARLLREFCPADPRNTGPVEGVEDVAFLRINGLAKLTSVRTLRRLGTRKRLVLAVAEAFAGAEAGSRAAAILIRLMGGLSNAAFVDPLAKALDNKAFRNLTDEIVDALGRIGDTRCHQTLENRLEENVKARVVDPPRRRHMEIIVAALGRIARHPRTSADDRNAIARRVLQTIPSDRALVRAALASLCSFDPAALAPDVQRMAVRFIVDSLWSYDTGSRLAQGAPNQRTELGFREELADILTNMGRDALPPLLEEAQRRVMQYSGAYRAMGDILVAIGDASAMPILRMMLLNTLRTDERTIPEHLRETYYDAAHNRRVPLTKDKVAHTLVFAIDKVGGREGRRLLEETAERIRADEIDPPGGETMGLLAEILVPGQLAEEKPKDPAPAKPGNAPRTAEPPAGALDVPPDWLDASDAEPPTAEKPTDGETAPSRASDADKAILKDIQGKGLFKPKIEQRVSAILEAARRGSTEFIAPLCHLLDDSEVVLRGAAETALLRIVRPGAAEIQFRIGLTEMLDFLRKSSEPQAKSISGLIMKMRPDRAPARDIIERYRLSEDNARMKRLLGDILDPPSHHPASRLQVVAPADAPPPAEGAAPRVPARPKDALQIKMEYMAARRAWIAGGKQGDPPPPPKGYSGS